MKLNFFRIIPHLRYLILCVSFFTFIQLSGESELSIYYPKEEWLTQYLQNMPSHHYKFYDVPGLARFWVDNGNDCVKDTIRFGKIWEPYVIDILKKYVRKGDRVIDVGAHIGTITLAMSNLVGDDGVVYAFEAERIFFRELYYNAYHNARKNIIPYLYWLGNMEEVWTIS